MNLLYLIIGEDDFQWPSVADGYRHNAKHLFAVLLLRFTDDVVFRLCTREIDPEFALDECPALRDALGGGKLFGEVAEVHGKN